MDASAQQDLALERDIALVYQRHITLVRGRARRILGSEAAADDIAQETFLRFLEVRAGGPSELHTAAYLYRTATNLALNRLRDERRRSERFASFEARTTLGDPPGRPDPDDLILLRKILSLVPDQEATIAAYYYLDGLEHEEIGELLGLPRRTVGRRLERFRDLARRLDKELR